MGKKRLRKKLVSKGNRSLVSGALVTATNAARDAHDKFLNKLDAWKKGQNPWITIDNPTKATNALKIRVRAEDYFGPYKQEIRDKKEKEVDYA
jgi:hypothetical protein